MCPNSKLLRSCSHVPVVKQCSAVSGVSPFRDWLRAVCPESSPDSLEILSEFQADDLSPPAWKPSETQNDLQSLTAAASQSLDDHRHLPRLALQPHWWWASPRTSSRRLQIVGRKRKGMKKKMVGTFQDVNYCIINTNISKCNSNAMTILKTLGISDGKVSFTSTQVG